MRTKTRHYVITLMMIFVMLCAVLLCGFHYHDDLSGDGIPEQACDICLMLEHVEAGALPIALAWVAIISISIHGLLFAPVLLRPLAPFYSTQPRAPPLV